MKIISRLNIIIFLLALILSIFLAFYQLPLPQKEFIVSQVRNDPPVVELIEAEPYFKEFNQAKYEITPKANIEMYGLVAEVYDSDSLLDVMHERDPAQTKDLCLIWGENIKNGVYQMLKYKHGEFTCFVNFKRDARNNFSGTEFTNTHLIPTNQSIRKLAKNTKIGDQVYLKGQIVTYKVYDEENTLIGSRGTSTTFEDRDCEVILVTDYQILKKHDFIIREARNISLATLGVSTILGVLLFLI